VIIEILILFSFKVLSNFSSFSPSPQIFQVAYFNHDIFLISVSSFEDPSAFISCETCQWLKCPLNGLRAQSWVSPVVGLLPLATGQACFGMAFPPFLINSYTAVTRYSLPRLWERGIPREGEDDCWVGEAIPCTPSLSNGNNNPQTHDKTRAVQLMKQLSCVLY
jgi:hypothetical protein